MLFRSQEAQRLRCDLSLAPELSTIRTTLERILLALLRRITGEHHQPQQRRRESELVTRLVLWASQSLTIDLDLMQMQEQFWLALERWPEHERATDFYTLAATLKVWVPSRIDSERSLPGCSEDSWEE